MPCPGHNAEAGLGDATGVADGDAIVMRVVVQREALSEERWVRCDWGGVDATLANTRE